ncbi:ATP-binding protein [Myxococcaceae bacterium GXIMD 01537]
MGYGLLEGLPLPACLLREGRLARANPSMVELLGVPAGELEGLSLTRLSERFAPREPVWEQTLSGPPSDVPAWVRLRGAGGQERTLLVRTGPGLDARERLLVLLDVEAEAAVRRLSEALVVAAGEMMHCRDEAAVLETAVDAIHRQGFFVTVLKVEGDTLRHGPLRQDADAVAWSERVYGQPISEVSFPRTSLPHLDAVLGQRKALFHADLHATLEPFHHPEVARMLRERFPRVRALDAPLLVQGEPLGILSVQGESLTPASAGTLELFARLLGGALENVRHHRAAEGRLRELARLQGELVAQERLSVLGEAAGVVAHEVRNPLGAILNAVAVLKREGRLGPSGASAVEMLEEEATRLEDMVRDLLDVVRPFEPRPRPLHLGELARRALGLVQARASSAGVRFELSEPEDLPLLLADETLLQLALSNLLRNALHASPQGGVVRVTLTRGGECVSLVVEDEGPGISAGADPKRAFEPFFTVRSTGAGLGLTVVRRVALAHGGGVHASNRPGRGARFELSLPLSGSEPRQE